MQHMYHQEIPKEIAEKKKRGKIGISTLRYSRFAIHFEKATTKKKKKL